jgi:hypothetical protein
MEKGCGRSGLREGGVREMLQLGWSSWVGHDVHEECRCKV